MSQTILQKGYAPIKKHFPPWIYNPVRSLGTAILGPILFGYKTGFFLSCFKRAAVSRKGAPLPWYTYPAIDFLKNRSFEGKVILEFGGGQSTHWWAQRAKQVVTVEGDREWYEKLRGLIPPNVHLHHISMENKEAMTRQVEEVLKLEGHSHYDVIVLDGLYRDATIPVAQRLVAEDGMILCDNAEGYGFHEGFRNTILDRVDFFGNAPGVVLPHCTCVYFNASSFAFSNKHPIPVIATEKND